LNKIINHYRWPTNLLITMNICSPIFEHSTPLSYCSFTLLHSGRKPPRILHIDCGRTHVFSVKRITAPISQLARLSIAGNITHSVGPRTNIMRQVIWWFKRQQRVMWCYLACVTSPPLLH
jgi:hypothetical protein